LHVLVIDDDPIVLDSTSVALSEVGHEVTTLPSAIGASSTVLREKPDVVLVDLQMPSLSGEQWLAFATERGFDEETAFVILSCAEIDELERLVRDTCAVAYVRKQEGPQAIIEALEKLGDGVAR
jgi:CheY-like chemotaxis protein